MKTYLVTFGSIFEHAIFMKNPKQYFANSSSKDFDIKVYNSKFCEIKICKGNQFFYRSVKNAFPHTKIVLKLQRGHKTKYINLRGFLICEHTQPMQHF